jgi:predicted Zn-dependent peptidase
VAVGAYVGVGGRDETPAVSGASHFLEHLLFKGTESRNSRDIAVAVDAVGGEMNAYTAREHTAFYARLPAPALRMGLLLLHDVLAEPALRHHEVEAERDVILEELAAAEDDPDDLVHMGLARALFPGHPLGQEVLGDRESIAALTRDGIAAFHRSWYRPGNLVVAAAGAVDHEQVVEAFAGFGAGGPSGAAPVRHAPTEDPEPRVTIRHPVEQAHLAMGWRAVDHHDPDRYPLAFANYVLGGGLASRLFQAVREERGLAYSIFSSTSSHSDCGSLAVSAATSSSMVGEVLAVVDDEIAALVESGITEAEHATALGYLEGSLLLGLEDPGSRMARIGRGIATQGEVVPVEEHLERFRAVTVADVDRVLRRVLGGPRSLALVGPKGIEKV